MGSPVVVDEWNRPSRNVVRANTINTVKKKLDQLMDGKAWWN